MAEITNQNEQPADTIDRPSENVDELSLSRLRYKEGRAVTVAGNKPLLLDNAEASWVVFTGMVDIFAVPLQD